MDNIIYSNIIGCIDEYIEDFGDKAYEFALKEDEMYREYLIEEYGRSKANVVAVGAIDGVEFAEYVGDNLGEIFKFRGYGEIYFDGFKVKGKFDLGNCEECVAYYRVTTDAPRELIDNLPTTNVDELLKYCVSVYEYFDNGKRDAA